jgi:hypothetical protein
MIPKAGDIVDINPDFKQAHQLVHNPSPVPDFGASKGDKCLHIYTVEKISCGFAVNLKGNRGGYRIDFEGRPVGWSAVQSRMHNPDRPLFVSVEELKRVPNVGEAVWMNNRVVDAVNIERLGQHRNLVLRVTEIGHKHGSVFKVHYHSEGEDMRSYVGLYNSGLITFPKSEIPRTVAFFHLLEETGGHSEEHDEDKCIKCDTMGNVNGLSCVCPNCGGVIWGI